MLATQRLKADTLQGTGRTRLSWTNTHSCRWNQSYFQATNFHTTRSWTSTSVALMLRKLTRCSTPPARVAVTSGSDNCDRNRIQIHRQVSNRLVRCRQRFAYRSTYLRQHWHLLQRLCRLVGHCEWGHELEKESNFLGHTWRSSAKQELWGLPLHLLDR